MNIDVLIIGGGAAGLTAAFSASGCGARVTVLEAAPRVGRKILASGNGRCNLANTGPLRYWGDQEFARRVLEKEPAAAVLDAFRRMGLVTVEEAGGRVYPGCGQAAAVLDTLRRAIGQSGAAVLCDARADRIEKNGAAFRVHTDRGVFEARRVIAACGGMAGGRLGHDGAPYRLLTDWGHTLIPPRPALTQLITEKQAVKGLGGLRLPARLTLCDGTAPVAAAAGEALFTDYGISGVCAMQLSRTAGEMLDAGKKPVLYLDFSPMLGLTPRVYDRLPAEAPDKNLPLVRACLRERRNILSGDDLLTGLCPRLLKEKLRGLRDDALARALAAYAAPVVGVKGFENAQVTRGGLSCREFSPETMESRLVPGLYCAGEMLDVDGDCGGYNLLFAFAGGILAGADAAESSRRSL